MILEFKSLVIEATAFKFELRSELGLPLRPFEAVQRPKKPKKSQTLNEKDCTAFKSLSTQVYTVILAYTPISELNLDMKKRF